jgi:aminoglycoside phosphotransferase (APT) family kinase protein
MVTPPAELEIDKHLITSLLAEQCPELAHLPVQIIGHGWDNVVARVGEQWAARVPRRRMSVALLVHEQRWLPMLAPSLPLEVPTPWFNGLPSDRCPWTWSICRWIPGSSAAEAPPVDPVDTARVLASFIAALHVPAPADAPENRYRGVALAERAEAVHGRVDSLGAAIDAPKVLAVWDDLHATTRWDGPPLWLHGDLHPSNMLTLDGRLNAVIDFGDLTSGDPGTDLAVAWMMFAAPERALFRELAQIDEATWRRAAGWALNLSLAYLTGDDSTSMPSIGRSTLAAVLTEFG